MRTTRTTHQKFSAKDHRRSVLGEISFEDIFAVECR